MQSISLPQVVAELTAQAHQSSNGRASRALRSGADSRLRQVVIALLDGYRLQEHESPGAATLYVLTGAIRVEADGQVWEGATGDHLPLPNERHSVEASEDSAFLLTVALG